MSSIDGRWISRHPKIAASQGCSLAGILQPARLRGLSSNLQKEYSSHDS